MHHTCPCLPGLACLRTSFNRFICLARKWSLWSRNLKCEPPLNNVRQVSLVSVSNKDYARKKTLSLPPLPKSHFEVTVVFLYEGEFWFLDRRIKGTAFWTDFSFPCLCFDLTFFFFMSETAMFTNRRIRVGILLQKLLFCPLHPLCPSCRVHRHALPSETLMALTLA